MSRITEQAILHFAFRLSQIHFPASTNERRDFLYCFSNPLFVALRHAEFQVVTFRQKGGKVAEVVGDESIQIKRGSLFMIIYKNGNQLANNRAPTESTERC